MKVICFHNPEEENGYLSNWYLSDFTIDDIRFTSMEQFMMYEKACCFNDEKIAKQILATNDVAKIKALGRAVKEYNDSYWNGVRQIIVYKGLLAKFSQNAELRENLINTGDVFIAECAVKDKIWGIGLSIKDEKRYDQNMWRGQNLLGYALMMVRKQLDNRNEK